MEYSKYSSSFQALNGIIHQYALITAVFGPLFYYLILATLGAIWSCRLVKRYSSSACASSIA